MSGPQRIKTVKTKLHKKRIDRKRIRRERQLPLFDNWYQRVMLKQRRKRNERRNRKED